MFSLAVIKALQVYGIAIVISLAVAVLIKLMVRIMDRLERPARPSAVPVPAASQTAVSAAHPAAPPDDQGIPAEVVAAISATLSTLVRSPYRILHISKRSSGWAESGRMALHASHAGNFKPGI